MLVIDANVALEACGQQNGFQTLGDELAAPPLMWSEARANLHRSLIKGEITAQDAAIMHERLDNCPVTRKDPPGLGRQAWDIAEEFGWGRTYDAEYIALAKILGCQLVTIDLRLWRGAKRLELVITPTEVKAHGDHHFPQTTVPGLVGTGPILPEWLRKPFRRIRTKHG